MTGDAPFSFQPDKMSFIDGEYSLIFLQEDSLRNLNKYLQRRGTWMHHSFEALSLSDHQQFCQCTFPFSHPNEGVLYLDNRACVRNRYQPFFTILIASIIAGMRTTATLMYFCIEMSIYRPGTNSKYLGLIP